MNANRIRRFNVAILSLMGILVVVGGLASARATADLVEVIRPQRPRERRSRRAPGGAIVDGMPYWSRSETI
jgi:hypothetical protein